METEDKKNTTTGEEKKLVSGEEKSAFQVSEKEWKDFVSNNVKEEIQKEIKAVSFSNKEIACKDEAIFRKYESSFTDKQIKLKKEYDNKIDKLQKEIEDNKKKIEGLQKSQSSKNQ